MKIGVISDTHLTRPNETLKRLVEELKDVDLLIHLGDIVSKSVLDFLKNRFQVYAVLGNMDPPELSLLLDKKMIIKAEGVRLGLTHGWGPPDGIEKRILSLFRDDDVDAILFGHTHNPTNRKLEGILMFNPGSPTDKVYAARNTYGILTVEGSSVKGEIKEFSG